MDFSDCKKPNLKKHYFFFSAQLCIHLQGRNVIIPFLGKASLMNWLSRILLSELNEFTSKFIQKLSFFPEFPFLDSKWNKYHDCLCLQQILTDQGGDEVDAGAGPRLWFEQALLLGICDRGFSEVQFFHVFNLFGKSC